MPHNNMLVLLPFYVKQIFLSHIDANNSDAIIFVKIETWEASRFMTLPSNVIKAYATIRTRVGISIRDMIHVCLLVSAHGIMDMDL
jgi:hypothetical protein